jgi:addiction module RelE/StbE family toxin
MSYTLYIPEHLDRLFYKLSKKDKLQFEILSRKIQQILENPEIGKPLTANMVGQRRVHIRNFVLTYQILENEKVVKLLDFDHHDKIYL